MPISFSPSSSSNRQPHGNTTTNMNEDTRYTDPSSKNSSSILHKTFLSGLNVSMLAEELSALENSNSFNAGKDTLGITPTGLLSHAIRDSPGKTAVRIPPRPRRLWNISDTKIPTYPSTYPRPAKHSSCYILSQPDSPPSVVAIRIAECLLARSVLTDYDEEAATATCLTIDRCLFVVHLWRVPPKIAPIPMVGKNDVVLLVECVRTSGNSFSFHRSARAVLQAAQGMGSGRDDRSVVQSLPLEYPRFTMQQQEKNIPNLNNMSSSSLNASSQSVAVTSNNRWNLLHVPTSKPSVIIAQVQDAMESVLSLLRKDRLKPQLEGMERLVALTDPVCVGLDMALHTALNILGSNSNEYSLNHSLGSECEIHQNWILELLVHRRLPTERNLNSSDQLNGSRSFSFSGCAGSLMATDPNNNILEQRQQSHSTASVSASAIDEDHNGKMRAMVLRAISNSLHILGKYQSVVLASILAVQVPVWTSEDVLSALTEDVQKATGRPVLLISSTRLASQHEAAVACRILRLLAQHNDGVKRKLMQNSIILDSLEQARVIGKSTHLVLADEAQKTYQFLTEDDRSF